MRDAGADAADGGYLVRLMWILWMTSSLSSHSNSATVSERLRFVTHTAVSSPQCNSEKSPHSKDAFTPDANRANDLHVKSMQRRNRQSCGYSRE